MCTKIIAVLDRDSIDLDPSQGVGILGLEGARETGDARARYVGELLATVARLQFARELIEAAVRDRLATLVVDHGVTQHPVEPPDDRVPNLIAPAEASNEGLLDDLLGDGAVVHAPLDVLEELAVVSD
jgi:hypothetical protein